MPHDYAIVISMTITNFNVKIILINNGSSIDILFHDAFYRMNLPKDRLRKINLFG